MQDYLGNTFPAGGDSRPVTDKPSESQMLEKFARYPLTFGPTYIEKLNRLSRHLGGKVEIYAKREDCN